MESVRRPPSLLGKWEPLPFSSLPSRHSSRFSHFTRTRTRKTVCLASSSVSDFFPGRGRNGTNETRGSAARAATERLSPPLRTVAYARRSFQISRGIRKERAIKNALRLPLKIILPYGTWDREKAFDVQVQEAFDPESLSRMNRNPLRLDLTPLPISAAESSSSFPLYGEDNSRRNATPQINQLSAPLGLSQPSLIRYHFASSL